MAAPDAIVVGGGVAGCAVAYALARAGSSVSLLERGELAGQASGAAAGMLLPVGEAEAGSPLLHWGARSLARFETLSAELRDRSGVDCEYEASGALHAAFTDERAERLRAKAPALAHLDVEWLEPDAARAACAPLSDGLRGALWSPREAHVRSPLLVRAYAGAAEALGVEIETGVAVLGLRTEHREGRRRVVGVETSSGPRPAGHVVLCPGAWAAECRAWLGARVALPVEPVRGQILALDPPLPTTDCIVNADDVYLVPKRDGSLVVGATEERVGFDRRVTPGGVARLIAGATATAPALANATFRSAWAGLRPTTPDGLPLIGPVPGLEGVLLAAGHSRNGVLLSPITGDWLADLVAGKALPADASAFRADRFAAG